MTSKSKRSKALYGAAGITPIMAMMVTTQPAHAALLTNAPTTLDVCSGVSLKRSDLTDVLQPIASSVTTLEGNTNGLINRLLGISVLGINIGGNTQTTNVGGTLNQALSGNDISLQLLDVTSGQLVKPSGSCYTQSDGVTLTTPKGIAIGGNAITGVGDNAKGIANAAERDAIAFGNDAATTTGATGAIALGASSGASAAGAVALGAGAKASLANSVALGAGSTTTRGAQASYTGYALTGTQTSAGEVSVGGPTGARQITNVAAGSADADAVNVAQLRAVDGRVTTNATQIGAVGGDLSTFRTLVQNGGVGPVQFSNGGIAANGGTATQNMTLVGADPTKPVTLHNVADGSVAMDSKDAVNGGQLFALTKSLGGTLSDLAVTYDAAAKDTITLGTSSAVAVSLRNVAAGRLAAGSTDAVNGDQLNTVATTVDGFDTRITATTTRANLLAGGGAGTVQFSNGGIASNGGTATQNMTLVGADPTKPVALHNVAAGSVAKDSTDAVNGGQLYDAVLSGVSDLAVAYDNGLHTSVTLGGLAGLPVALKNVAPGTVSLTSTDAVNGGQLFAVQKTAGDALSTVTGLVTSVTGLTTRVSGFDDRITANTSNLTTVTASADLLRRGGSGPVQYSAGGTTPNGGTVTQDLTLVGADTTKPVALHNVAAGSVAKDSTDAVNGGQLYDAVLSGVSDLAVAYDDTAHSKVTLGGATAAAPVALGNVKAGAMTATSTDAVNGAQLFAVDARATLLGNGGSGLVQFSNGGIASNGGTATQNMTLVGADPTKPVALHNVAAGSVAKDSTDAVNGGQLYDAVLSGVSDLAVAYDDTAHSKVTLGGATATAPVALGNVKAGAMTATSTDAVNGAQLYAVDQRVDGVSTTVNAFDGRITAVDARATLLANGGAGPVQYSAGGTTPNGGTATQHLTLVGADPTKPVALHNVAAGSVAKDSTDAVNGGQLYDAVISGVSDLAVAYDDTAHSSVTLGGVGAAAPVALTNVKAGVLSASSLDAVNGAQLAGFGTAVAARLGGVTYNPATNSFTGGFTYAGTTYDNVQSVFGAIEAQGGSGGTAANGKYFHANSTMADSAATGQDSTAIGPSSSSAGAKSVAMGSDASAESDHSVAIGSGATAKDGMAVSIGMGNIASGDGAVAIGDPSIATGDGAVVLGKDNEATGTGAIALGNVSKATGDGAAAIGDRNVANGQGAVSLGTQNLAAGLGSIAVGASNQVNGDGSLAIGSGIVASATDTMAIGSDTAASAVSAVALGNRSLASGASSLAVGNDADATMQYATAVGAMAQATNVASTSLGIGATASGYASTALGAGATVTHDNSVALGSAVETTRGAQDNYVAFGLTGAQRSNGEIAIGQNMVYTNPATGQLTTVGDRQITGVAGGSADTDAVNVGQLRGVSSSVGTALATSLGGGARYDAGTGAVTGPTYTLGGVTYASVGDALAALARSGGTGGGSASGGTVTNAVTFTDAGHTSVTLGDGGTTVRNVADGNVATGSTDAVNGGQLAQVQTQVTTLAQQVQTGATGAVRYSNGATPTTANGGTVTNDVTLVGANASAPVAMHNVADGSVAAGSTDAVNGGQLAATNARVATVETASANAVQYDSGAGTGARTSLTLGNGSDAVALHNVADGTTARDAVNLGQLSAATQSAVEQSAAYTDSRIKALSFDLGKVRRDASAGVAGAMALAGMPQPTEAGRGMVSMGMGAFAGQQAIALGIAKAMADEHTVMKVGATYNTRRQVGVNLGVGYQF